MRLYFFFSVIRVEGLGVYRGNCMPEGHGVRDNWSKLFPLNTGKEITIRLIYL